MLVYVQVAWTYCNSTQEINSTRFSVQCSSNLLISNVTAADAGPYLCTEDGGFADMHLFILSVMDTRKNFSFQYSSSLFQFAAYYDVYSV